MVMQQPELPLWLMESDELENRVDKGGWIEHFNTFYSLLHAHSYLKLIIEDALA